AGTLGTAFYLIPWIGTRAILYLLGGLLILSALIAAAGPRLPRIIAAAIACFVVLQASPPGCAEQRVLLERDSPYHRLFVTEDQNYRWLRADNWCHTQMQRRDPHGRGLSYTDYTDIAFLFNPKIRSVLVIGLGGGTIPKRFVRDYPQVKVDAVEIDPDVIKIAARYFDVHPGPRLAIHQSDGRMFLRRSKQSWDLIVLDAYYAETAPFFLATREFFEIARRRLTPGGVMVNNVIGATRGPTSRFFRSVYRTMKETFPQVHAFQVPDTGFRSMNIEVFALNSKDPIGLETLRTRAAAMQGSAIKDDELTLRLKNYVGHVVPIGDVPTLTDDYAPVDGLIHFR
ncbi:MAG: fused MFS/spermidine synthase, partial [Armatimonadota bacterium]